MMQKARKSRWGMGIVAVFVLFVAVMLGVTGYLMSQDVPLVTDSYYEKELRFQERIEASERTLALGSAVECSIGNQQVRMQFPRTVPQSEIAGQILLYRPADHSADRTIPVRPDSAWQQLIPTSSLLPGLWRLQVQWAMRGEDYYFERPFMVQ